MKNLITSSLLLLALLLPAAASAYDFEVDGIYYEMTGNEVSVTSSPNSNQYSGDVTIPAAVTYNDATYSVTSIGNNAFEGCSDMASINIPNSVISIGDYAFCGCSAITSITIPNSVTSIGENSFWLCTGLTSFSIGNSLESFASNQFYACNNLSNISVAIDNPYLDSRNDCNAIIETASNTLIAGCKNTVIPNTVNIICFFAFCGCSGLTSIDIPNSVTDIFPWAFSECTELTSISIPSSVNYIGNDAFYGCTKMERVNITDLDAWCRILFEQNDLSNPCYNAHHLFLNGEEIKDLIIPETITSIGNYAFCGCSEISNVTIPGTVTSIGEEAFYGCTNLTNLTCLATTPPAISSSSFSNETYSRATLTVPRSCGRTYRSADVWNSFSRIVERYYDVEVDGIYYLIDDISLEAYVTGSPDSNQYSGNVTIPSTITYNGCTCPVVFISDMAFANCSGLTSVSIPNSVTAIGQGAFSDCTGLTSITIPSSIVDIYEGAFSGCGLTSITVDSNNPIYDSRDDCNAIIETASNTLIVGCMNTIIPNTVTCIANFAFGSHKGLTSIIIPNSVTSIGVYAFSLTGLTSIDIPNSVSFIGQEAFVDCTELTDVYSNIIDPSMVNTGRFVFGLDPGLDQGNYSNRTLHVPVGTVAAYQADTRWSEYFGTIVEMEEVPDNYFSMPDTAVFHGETIVVPVRMINVDDVMAFQTDILLPEGFSIVTDENNEPIIAPSSRLTSDHVIMADQLSNGSVRVICYTPHSKVINGNEGDLFYITVVVPEDAGGAYSLYLRNSLLTTTDYEELDIPDAVAELTVYTYIPGDVNDSRTVNVTDIVVAAQYILQRDPRPFIFEAADMNGDGSITVTDIMLIARLIMTPPMNAPKRQPAIIANGDRMSGVIALAAGETRKVTLALDNVMDYSAFQLDLNLPDGLNASNFALTDRAGSHILDVETIGNGKLRALCYSPTIASIIGSNGALLTFDVTVNGSVTGDIMVDGIEFVSTACQPVLLGAFTIDLDNVTAVNEVATGKTIARVDYYNLAGQRIARPENGLTLVVTTYTDGTRTTTKLLN